MLTALTPVLAPLLLALLLLGAATGCTSPSSPAAPTPPVPEPSSAPTAWVAPRSARGMPLTEAPAQVLAAPEATAAMGLPFRGSVVRVAVRPGQRVQRGEVLVEVLLPEVVQAAGAWQGAALRREAWEKRVAQLQSLQAQGLARAAELTEAETRLAEARAEQQAALAVLRAAGLGSQEASSVLQRGTLALRSPVEGVVTEVSAALGEVREAGGAPLVRVVGEAPARLEARLAHTLPEPVEYEFAAPGLEPLPVRAVGQSPALQAQEGTRLAWFEPQPPKALPAGLQGTLRVRAGSLEGVHVVPARALVLKSGEASVLVRTPEGPPRQQPVQVLATSGAEALVRGELSTSDRVAADASRLLPSEGGHDD